VYVCLVKAFNGIVAAVLSRSAIAAAAGFYALNANTLFEYFDQLVECVARLA
jgi:hypothetical protein